MKYLAKGNHSKDIKIRVIGNGFVVEYKYIHAYEEVFLADLNELNIFLADYYEINEL